jgi:cation transport ATPase
MLAGEGRARRGSMFDQYSHCFVETVAIAQRTRRIIWQNFTGTIAVDTIGVVLASLGFLNPLLAAFIHVSSES